MSLGSFLKRATTIPKKGLLSPLRKVLGKSFADELGGGLGFIVGGPLGAGIGSGVGTTVNTGNVGKGLISGLKGYGAGVGANAALSGLGGGGIGGAMAELRAGARPFTNIARGASQAVGLTGAGTTGAGGAATGSGGNVLSRVLDWAKKNPELLLGGAGLAQSALTQHGADSSRNQALDLYRQQYDDRRPLFAALAQRLMQPQAAPVSTPYRDPSNPFAR